MEAEPRNIKPYKRLEDYANSAPEITFGGCGVPEIATAVACGILGGIVDVLFVGAPNDGRPLEKWADKQVDGAVENFAKLNGWRPKEGQSDVAHAIGFLEKSFKVNYDQRYGADVGGLFAMNTRDHHFKSLAHSPTPVGLFFSMLNQFTSTATFAVDGGLVFIKTDTFELLGKDFPSKIFCGFVNWLGHIMSDIAGSSVLHRFPGDGMGVAAPFCELLQFCKFGNFNIDEDKGDLAELATKVFTNGYDARFALSLGIPVAITDLLIKLIWAVKEHFGHGKPILDCVRAKDNDGLRTMLLIGTGTLCVVDGADAYVRSGGGANAVELASRINYIAWLRLAMLVIRELQIRLSLERDIEAMKALNAAYKDYLEELEALDIETFKRESLAFESFSVKLDSACTEEELNALLMDAYEKLGLSKPWQGDFDEHMADKTATLRFS